jgi:two-component system nitrate/nitrite sensor histidine kinase NarX
MTDSKIRWAKWLAFAALIFIVEIYLLNLTPWNPWLSVLVAFLGSITLTSAIELWLHLFRQRFSKQTNADKSSTNIAEDSSPTQISLNSLRQLLQVHTEKEILEVVIKAGVELLGVNSASFVPYDEWGQSLPAIMHGKMPDQALQSWAQRLSLPETRQVCKNCESYHAISNCVLLSPESTLSTQIKCFPLSSGGRDVGVINFYFDKDAALDVQACNHFSDILVAAGQSLENLRSRDREIATLLYLQTNNSPKSDLSILLNSLVENVQRALEVDFAMLYLPGGVPGQLNSNPQYFSLSKGDVNTENPTPDLPFLEGVWKSVLTSGHSVSLENVKLNKHERWKAFLAVPLVWHLDEPVGVLVLGSNSSQAFTQRHQALLETLAGQAALLIQNARLMVQVEYQAVVDERTRLAREIHDGLAQTLAFLKIQAAQMQNFLERGETEKLTNTLQANYRTLSDAYIDARQAIDDLRRVPTTNLCDWIDQVAADYKQTTNQKVNVSIAEFSTKYPANIQAQLIRIVQEALSNVRKHADATTVDILGFQEGDSYLFEIRDNGRGFTPESGHSEGNSHYGLRGMRERSESIGADFQITSQPGMGTCISIHVPSAIKEEL